MSLVRVLLAAVVILLASCTDDGDSAISSGSPSNDVQADSCIIRLHGRSDTGAPPELVGTHAELSPIGNAAFGDGHEWVYDSEATFDEARSAVVDAADAADCRRIVINGFSNGAAFAGHLVCAGEDFDGRLVGAVVDDPVPDEGTMTCRPSPGVEVTVYWTGALDVAEPGVTCESLGWTCIGDVLVGIDAYARGLDVPVTPSPNSEHEWFRDAPELLEWLDVDEG
ncbi:MAG: hypothetical protein ACXIVQ_09185 [Acidimicrobiales bacterium]